MTRRLEGRPIAAAVRSEVATAVAAMVEAGHRPPGLAVLLVGENPASRVYVDSKERAAREAGMVSRTVRLAASATAEQIAAAIDDLNGDPEIDGFLVQLPLPDGVPTEELLARVDPEKDVDGFHPINVGRLWRGRPGFVPATTRGIVELLERSEIPIEGRRAVIVGRSDIVGKPIAALLLHRHATVTICHSRTRELDAVCREAEILVAAVGRPGMIGAQHVREGAVVVDVGINRLTERSQVERLFPSDEAKMAAFREKGSVLTGDVDFVRVAPKAAAITPVPGGVGPLTVALLLANALDASRRRQGVEAQGS